MEAINDATEFKGNGFIKDPNTIAAFNLVKIVVREMCAAGYTMTIDEHGVITGTAPESESE